MNAKTHFLSGVIAGYLAETTWKGALVGGFAALLPDIDEPKSYIGRLVPFLSVPMRAFVSHRTLTHSLLFVLAAGAIFSSIDQAIAIACIAGLVAHIIGDLLTGRVQLFWPFKLWVGLPVPRIVYGLIDRIAFISLLALILWKGIKPFMNIFF
jgi:Predicted membrane-bound metal-dependent hydrolases